MKRLFLDFFAVLKKHMDPSGLFLVALLPAILLAQMSLGIGCPIHFVTGINCPGCGMSRALFHVLRLDFAGAFVLHPLWWLLPVLAIFWLLRESKRISHKTYQGFLWVFALLFLAVYAFRLLNPANTLVCASPKEGLILRILTHNV